MKQYRFQILAVLLSILSSSFVYAQDVSNSEYFRHLMFRESPFAQYKGIYPISKSEAQSVAHYKFNYDDNGRVVSIAHQIGDEVINDNQNWDSFIWFAPKVTIKYTDKGEVHQYFNADNEQIHAHGNVYTATYQYDAKGQRQSLVFSDNKGEPSENAWNINRYEWGLDDQQRIIETRYSADNKLQSIRPEFKFFETRLAYDNDGKLEFMYNYGLESKPTNNDSGAGIDRIYYDHNGNFQRWQVFSKDHQPVAGNRPMVHVGEHLYDSYGNKVGLRGFDTKGQQIAFSWGVFEHSNEYDQYGNKVKGQLLDSDGNIVDTAVTVFSDDGIKRELFKVVDNDGKLVASPRLNGAAAIKFEYEEGTKKVANRIALDKSLTPISPK